MANFLALQMEFSFGTQKWLPRDRLQEQDQYANGHSLGLHAPGFFDKVLHIEKCLLQSEAANMVCSWNLYCYTNFKSWVYAATSTNDGSPRIKCMHFDKIRCIFSLYLKIDLEILP